MFEELRDLDVQCARALGLHVVIDYETIHNERIAVGWYIGEKEDEDATSVLRYSTDPALTPILLEEIKRRKLYAQYISALGEIVPHYRCVTDTAIVYPPMAVWAFLTATPEQHARAFLLSVATQSP